MVIPAPVTRGETVLTRGETKDRSSFLSCSPYTRLPSVTPAERGPFGPDVTGEAEGVRSGVQGETGTKEGLDREATIRAEP